MKLLYLYMSEKISRYQIKLENMPVNGINNYLYIKHPKIAVTNKLSAYNVNSKNTTDTFTHVQEKKSTLRKDFEEIKKQQGIIGKCWDGFKNLFGFKSGSKYVEKIIKQAEKGQITEEEAQQALEKYKEGQKTCVDVAADIASGILSVGAFALAVPTGGASLAVGLAAATAVGAGVKIGIKAGDAIATGKEYSKKDLIYDFATGSINGLMAPITNGLGNCVTKTIGKKFGLKIIGEGAEQAAKQVVKQSAAQGIKSAIINQTIDVAGGTITKRAIALGAGMAVDGALGGASDNMIRAALNGENIFEAGVQGAVGGLIMAPVIGGGFRVAGKAATSLNNKITTKLILPDGLNTKFRQGQAGDCALLSTIDAMMNNAETAKLIKKSITKTPFGDYNVKIGDNIVRVAKSSLSDEMLSDTTGIKIFEAAYKQLNGSLDGGFAEAAAKQFGLNPVHITNDNITDELLNKLAKEQGNNVLSFGTLVDNDGAINLSGSQRHYFTIKDIDADKKLVKLTSPIDTSKTIELSYDEVKQLGISIDGGTVKQTSLPNSPRLDGELKFKGIDIDKTKSTLAKNLDWSEDKFADLFSDDLLKVYSPEKVSAFIDLYDIKPKEFTDLVYKISKLNEIPINDADNVLIFQEALKGLELYPVIKNNPILGAFHFSLDETYDLYQAVLNNSVDDIYKILDKNNILISQAIKEQKQLIGKDLIVSNMHDFYRQFTETSINDVISPENIVDIGIINGQHKKIIFPNATSITNGSYTVNYLDLIKSNMITTDLIDICLEKNIPLRPVYKVNIKAPNAQKKLQKFQILINPNELIERVKKFGIGNLSSNEIHALTEMFTEMYEDKGSKLASAITSYYKNPSNAKKVSLIYNYVKHLKTLAASELSDGKVIIGDHAFMRMLDRNLVSVTDNKTSQVLSYKQLIKLLKENALKGNTQISGFNGAEGIKMILTKDNSGRIIIDSVM